MRVLSTEVHRMDNDGYIDADVIVTMDDKYHSQYRWTPSREVSTGRFSEGTYEFADTPVGDWEPLEEVPPAVKLVFIGVLREVAGELGVSYIRLLATMTQRYDLGTLGVAGSEVLDPL